jgi:hypothetical protein
VQRSERRLFDHVVGRRKQGWRNFDRERFCCVEVDKMEFYWLLDRQIGRLGASRKLKGR